MTRRSRTVRLVAAATAGGTLALVTEIGGSLLLYRGPGALTAAGALLALLLSALAAGLWAGRPDADDGRAPASRWRWRFAALALLAAGIYTARWLDGPPQATGALSRVGAVLLLLGAPAYMTGSLLAILQARGLAETEAAGRRGGGTLGPALIGAAAVAVAAAVLIPRVGALLLLVDGALVVALVGTVEGAAGEGPIADTWSFLRSVSMDGKVALITGVGRRGQVGYAIAEAFLRAGAGIAITNVHETVEELAGELGELLGAEDRIAATTADLTRGYEVERLIGFVRRRFGRLDALVNVAGGLSVIKSATETTDEEWRREMERNAQTAFVVCREALPLLRRNGGAIVNFASPAGEHGAPRLVAYSAAKAAVIALTRSLAQEESEHGVRVNAIAPGMVDTEQNRSAMSDVEGVKWVTREQIASVTVFLASPASAGITGEVVNVLGEV